MLLTAAVCDGRRVGAAVIPALFAGLLLGLPHPWLVFPLPFCFSLFFYFMLVSFSKTFPMIAISPLLLFS